MSSSFPKAVLYTFQGSVWAAVPELCFVEKGYNDDDYEMRQVNLLEAENFSPTYLRINSGGTVPTLLVPLAETTGQEQDTKFRALSDSVEITQFLDASRSQQILDLKGVEKANPAPVLAPATIEVKAASDELIKLVHDPSADPNALLLAARTVEELSKQRQGLQGTFCRNRLSALERQKAEAQSSSGGENPRTVQVTEQLVKWYNDKISALAPLNAAYLSPDDAQAADNFVQYSLSVWEGVLACLAELEQRLTLPFAMGDQFSLADLHVIAWLTRVFAVVTKLEDEQDEFAALQKALQHPTLQGNQHAALGLGEKVKKYYATVKERPSFKKVYASGIH